jgi:uncharacterized protein YneF (UPF0154 family)
MVFDCILLFIFQLSFNIFKTMEIRYTYNNEINKSLINSLMINLVSLASLYFSIDALIQGNLYMIASYICGSLSGKFVSMKYIKKV